MASTNFKLFDENKVNMMSDTEYNIASQRLNGVQTGIASSKLQNKTLYQTSLVAYAISHIMNQNGLDASDTDAVSTFVSNMSGALLQKVMDKATDEESKAGIITNKWISPASMKAACLLLSGGTMSGNLDMGGNIISNVGSPISNSDVVNKQYVDESKTFKEIKVVENKEVSLAANSSIIITFDFPNYPSSKKSEIKGIKYSLKNIVSSVLSGSSFILYFSSMNNTGYYIFFDGAQNISNLEFISRVDTIKVVSNAIYYKHYYSGSEQEFLSVRTDINECATPLYSYNANFSFNLDLYLIF